MVISADARQRRRAAGWVVVLASVALACAIHDPAPNLPPASPLDGARAQDRGAELFSSYCAACHQYDGKAGGEAPPLDGSPWVRGPEGRLIRIVLDGLRGRLEIRGEVYDREMPGFGSILSDTDLALLLSSVRGRFGDPGPAISSAAIAAVRQATAERDDYWSVDELLALP